MILDVFDLELLMLVVKPVRGSKAIMSGNPIRPGEQRLGSFFLLLHTGRLFI